MKKGMFLICVLLAALLAVPALAQSTGVYVNGKTYVITGSDGTYEMDGMTFVIEGDTITVTRPGEEELRLSLEAAEETDVVEGAVSGSSVTVYAVEDAGEADDGKIHMIFTEDVQTENTASVGKVTVYSCSEDEGSIHVVEDVSDAITSSEMYTVTYSGSDLTEEYSAYAQYGLGYDSTGNILYYQGKRVRVFEDGWALDDNSAATLEYFDDEGEVDVRGLRNEQGEITGVEALSDAEFAARDLSAWMEPNVTRMEMTATDGEELTPEELEAFFEPYAAFGLRYDAERDLLFYQDKQVRKLVDIRVSNGAEPGSGNFSGELTQLVYDGGEVDVTAIRDYEQPDAEGNGKLIGLNVEEIK